MGLWVLLCSLVDRELAFRGNGGSSTAVNRPHCAEFVNVMKGRDLLQNCLNSATVIWFHIAGSLVYFMKFAIPIGRLNKLYRYKYLPFICLCCYVLCIIIVLGGN